MVAVPALPLTLPVTLPVRLPVTFPVKSPEKLVAVMLPVKILDNAFLRGTLDEKAPSLT